jgi:hypothetical protein
MDKWVKEVFIYFFLPEPLPALPLGVVSFAGPFFRLRPLLAGICFS